MARPGSILERISQIETSIVAELDQIVEHESARLVTLIDTEGLYLRAVLDETAREITLGGELAAARVMRRGLMLADAYREKDPLRADRVELSAMGCHDQVRGAAQALAERALAYEPSLSAPLNRTKREALNDHLPSLKLRVQEAARRMASDLRRRASGSGSTTGGAGIPGPPAPMQLVDEVEAWRKQLVDGVRHVRTAAKDRVDMEHKRARAEVERVVEELAGLPAPVRKRLNEVVDPTRIDPILRTGSEGRPTAPMTRGQRVLAGVGAVATVLFVFLLGVASMGAGIGVAAGAFLALALRGSEAPILVGGMLMGLTGSTFGAFATDAILARTGDWRTSVRVAVFGSHTALQGLGKAVPSRDLAMTLQYVELPPLSPDRVATAAAPGALRLSLQASNAEAPAPAAEQPMGPIRVPSPSRPRES
jgi:hypothetical protein